MPAAALPANPFYASPEQRVALARQRFFEDGVRPTGMVSEAVLQSWSRCLRSHADANRPAVFEPVTPSRVHGALRANRDLLEAAAAEMERLRATLAGTSGTALLTDAQGMLIGSTFTQARSHERLMPLSTRVGVNLSEEVVGTTAPGITARTGQLSVVQGAEHFFGNVQTMHCAAAPIRDVRGRLAGVLDLSSEGVPFGFDAASVVAHYAAEIENRLLVAQSSEHLVVRMQISPALLDTPMAALLGITSEGCIDWLNGAAARLLGVGQTSGGGLSLSVEQHLGLPLATLLALVTSEEPQPLRLPNGLMLWLRLQLQAHDGHARLHAPVPAPPAPDPAPASPSTTLREAERQAVARMLAECDGNVSKAARALGVSRGLIYRQLKAADA